jgi:exodeoxyribonuclease V alpha subunit
MSGPTASVAAWRDAGLFEASDVQIASALARLCGDDRPEIVLAAALAARAPRLGDSCVDLSVRPTTADDAALSWPALDAWLDGLAESPLVVGVGAPLVLRGSQVALERYHTYEVDLAEQLGALASAQVVPIEVDLALLDGLLAGDGSAHQRAAVERALKRGLTVLAGGPGTGKTTTVAALVATLVQSLGSLRIALAAPTGKAAARLGEAFRAAATRLPADLAAKLATTPTSTIHRLLGVVGDSSSRFRHGPDHPLPFDLVIVDEASMVSLPLMAKLVGALAPQARLVVVGDPGQLASVDAGSVLADIVGPVAGHTSVESPTPGRHALAGCISVLTHSRRFPPGSAIDRFARAIGSGDAAAARAVLEASSDHSTAAPAAALDWYADTEQAIAAVRSRVEPVVVDVAAQAARGAVAEALDGIDRIRVLCAHRLGSMGVAGWNERIESWLAAAGRPASGWYPGRPVMVTANDYRLGLFNGDVGVVVLVDGRTLVAFPSVDGPRLVAPSRLESVETVHATTIHKSQGSEFDEVVVVLPPVGSRLASRELLYTAVTRARHRVSVVGAAEALDEVVARRTLRASGLREMLWGPVVAPAPSVD